MAKEEFVTRQRFAQVIGVDVRTISNWRRDHADFPVRVRGRRVEIPLTRGVKWFVAFRIADEMRRRLSDPEAGKPLTPAQRKDLADAKIKELNYEERLLSLIPREDAANEVAAYQERVRAVILAMPGRHATDSLTNLPTVGRVLQQLKSLAALLLQDLLDDVDAMETDDEEPAA